MGEEIYKESHEELSNRVNADYFSPSKSRIRIFTNHIEFCNPGGLPKDIEILKTKDISLPRNPIITKLYRMVKLAENAGFGIDKIEHNWFKYNNTKPNYILDFDSTIVSFRVSDTKNEKNELQTSYELNGGLNGGLNKKQSLVLDYIKNNSGVKVKDMVVALNIPVDSMDKYIKYLVKEKLIERRGSKKTGGYYAI